MIGSVLDKSLYQAVLLKPPATADTLRIVSGYATAAMASRHILDIKRAGGVIDIDLIVGMVGDEGLGSPLHKAFINLEKKNEFPFEGSFSCSYIMHPPSVHSKLYVWCKGDSPVRAFIGSANYSQNGFVNPQRMETLSECDPNEALSFFRKIKKESTPCASAMLERGVSYRRVRMQKSLSTVSPGLEKESDKKSPYYGCAKVEISLINTKGTLGSHSGINWGLDELGEPRPGNKKKPGGKRRLDEAYIRVPKAISDTGFFPAFIEKEKKPEKQTRFTVLTDDGRTFSCVRVSGGYGKEIETPHDNTELGRYFRDRIGVPYGTYVTVADMQRYGRTSVVFYKINDETYVMDFSKPKVDGLKHSDEA